MWEWKTNFLFDNIGNMNIISFTSSMANCLIPQDGELERIGFAFCIRYWTIQNRSILLTRHSCTYQIQGFMTIVVEVFYFNLEVNDNVIILYHLIIKNCYFQRNALNILGSGVIVGQFYSALSSTSGLEVLVQNTSFTNHTIPELDYSSMEIVFPFNVITAYSLKHLNIINSTFAMNKQTALQAFGSTLYFGGNVIFSGNNGTLGGALMLQGGSTVNLMPTLMFKSSTIMPREEVASTLKMKIQ